MTEINLYAAVRYFGSDSQSIHYVPVKNIIGYKNSKNFDLTTCHFIKKINLTTKKEELVPAQIHVIGNSLEELKNHDKRLRPMNKRYSDAYDESKKNAPIDLVSNLNKVPAKLENFNSKINNKVSSKGKELRKKIKAAKCLDLENIMNEKLKSQKNNNTLEYDDDEGKDDIILKNDVLSMQDLQLQFEEFKKRYQNELDKKDELIRQMQTNIARDTKDPSTSTDEIENVYGTEDSQSILDNGINLVDKIKNSVIVEKPNSHETNKVENSKTEAEHTCDHLKPSCSYLTKTCEISNSKTSKEDANINLIEATIQIDSPKSTKKRKKEAKRKLDYDQINSTDSNVEKRTDLSDNLSDDEQVVKRKKIKNKSKKSKKTNLSDNSSDDEQVVKRKKIKHKSKKSKITDLSDNSSVDEQAVKKKKIKKSKRCKSDSEYDSDKFEKSNYEDFSSWVKNIKGKSVKMFHLKYDVSIRYDDWLTLKCTDDLKKYLRLLAKFVWTEYHLMNRAISLKKCKDRLMNRSPRKSLTPIKKAALRKVYFQRVDMTILSKKMRRVYKNQFKSILGTYINSLIEKQKVFDKTKEAESDSESSSSDNSDSSSI